MRLSPVVLLATLTLAATAGASADLPPGTESFAVFGAPVDTTHPMSGATCPDPAAWDGPVPGASCVAPIAGNGRLVALDDGPPVLVAPVGRWVCLAVEQQARCVTQAQALAGKAVLGHGGRVVHLVPNWVEHVEFAGDARRARENIVVVDEHDPRVVLGYARTAARGGFRRAFRPRIPNEARRFRIFRLPLGRPRSLTRQEQARVSLAFGQATFGPMTTLARRFGASDWVAVPGSRGIGVTNLANLATLSPEILSRGSGADGADYVALGDSYGPTGTMGCASTEGCAAGTPLSFMQLVPDYVRWADVAGERFVPIDGLVYGQIVAPPDSGVDIGTVFKDLVENVAAWKARRTSRRPRDAAPPTASG